ncbi:MAG: lytic transglycosylase domain-containing protein [Magnetococcales bacterium]|nr:lytic transglycosylase domain-containing protein [Magnetococcales bacterium]
MHIFAHSARRGFFSVTGDPLGAERDLAVGKWRESSWRDHRLGVHFFWISCLFWMLLVNMSLAWSRSPPNMDRMIEDVAYGQGLDPVLLRAVVAVESDFNPRSVSSKGALGLMQLMPGTAHDMGLANPFNPEQNLRAGARYLKLMLERFPTLPMALAAYNAGPSAVENFGGIPPYPETRHYIRKVLEIYWRNAHTLPQEGKSYARGSDRPPLSALTMRRERNRMVITDGIPLRPYGAATGSKIVIRRSSPDQDERPAMQLARAEDDSILRRDDIGLISSGVYINQRLDYDIPVIRLERFRR